MDIRCTIFGVHLRRTELDFFKNIFILHLSIFYLVCFELSIEGIKILFFLNSYYFFVLNQRWIILAEILVTSNLLPRLHVSGCIKGIEFVFFSPSSRCSLFTYFYYTYFYYSLDLVC